MEVGLSLDGALIGAYQNLISVLHIIRILLQQGLEAATGADGNALSRYR